MKHTRTWILVADGGRARILERTGKREGVHLIAGSQASRNSPPYRELTRDTPAHGNEASRLAVEPRSDPRTALEALFASQLATMLAEHSAKEAFDRLIIIAPSTMLGNLRKMLKPEVRHKVVAEIDKDPIHIPTNEIAAHIDKVIDA